MMLLLAHGGTGVMRCGGVKKVAEQDRSEVLRGLSVE